MEGIDPVVINELKSRIENMKNQVDLLTVQNTSLAGNSLKEKLYNLSFQIINDGIYVYRLGQHELDLIDYDKIKEKFQKISEEINSLIDHIEHEKIIQIQKMMMFQQQTYMFPPQMPFNQFNMEDIEIKFVNINGNNKKIKAKKGTTVEEALKKYMSEAYGNESKKLRFISNAEEIKLDDKRKVEYVFKNHNLITVMEC